MDNVTPGNNKSVGSQSQTSENKNVQPRANYEFIIENKLDSIDLAKCGQTKIHFTTGDGQWASMHIPTHKFLEEMVIYQKRLHEQCGVHLLYTGANQNLQKSQNLT